MISVLIETRNDEEALARTLASLIGGAVEGVVREVIVCDLGSTDQTHYVAEHAGCGFLGTGGAPAGVRQAKGDWLLLLEPGARLADGWTDEVVAHTTKLNRPARFSRAKADRLPFLSRIFTGKRGLAAGLLISKRQALALSRTVSDAEGIARGLATKELRAEIWIAPR